MCLSVRVRRPCKRIRQSINFLIRYTKTTHRVSSSLSSSFNDSHRVREWDSTHSFANIDVDERQSPQTRINASLPQSYIYTKWVVSSASLPLCSSLSLFVARFRFYNPPRTDAHLDIYLLTHTWKNDLYWNVTEPTLNYKNRILKRYYTKNRSDASREDHFNGCQRNVALEISDVKHWDAVVYMYYIYILGSLSFDLCFDFSFTFRYQISHVQSFFLHFIFVDLFFPNSFLNTTYLEDIIKNTKFAFNASYARFSLYLFIGNLYFWQMVLIRRHKNDRH